ncbi:MAG TPA: DUF4097 domain-containing protein [Firmicutes bacterium]|nr:DUF4097 domain-containing protein [Bacillota bacterium]
MKDTLKSLLRTSVIALIIGIIIICVLLRVSFDKISGMILDGIRKTGELVDISSDGLNIADYIVIENGTIKIGGKTVEFGSGITDGSSDGSLGEALDNTDFAQNRYTFASDVNRALDIDIHNCDLIVATADDLPDNSIVVDVFESDDYKYEFTTADNTLYVTDSQAAPEQQTLDIFGFKINLGAKEKAPVYTGLVMVVYLPDDFGGEISLKTTNGDIKAGGLSLDENLTLETNNGIIELSDSDAYSISALTSSGRIAFDRLSAIDIEVETSDAGITLTDLTIKRLTANTSNGPIDFSGLIGEKFEFTTSDGNISGSIDSQESLFSIITEADGGSCSPKSNENDRAQYQLTAKTSDGDINIRFAN